MKNILLLTTFLILGCQHFKGDDNVICSEQQLSYISKEYREEIKTFLEKYEYLFTELTIAQVKEIIAPCKKDQNIGRLKIRYKKISRNTEENFSGKSKYIKAINNIKNDFIIFVEREKTIAEDNKDEDIELKYANVIREKEIKEERKKRLAEEEEDLEKTLIGKEKTKGLFEEIKQKINLLYSKCIPSEDTLTRLDQVITNLKSLCQKENKNKRQELISDIRTFLDQDK